MGDSKKILDAIKELERKIDSSVSDQAAFRKSVEDRFDNLKTAIDAKISAECKSIRDEFQLEIVQVKDRVTIMEQQMLTLNETLIKEIDNLKDRMETVEKKDPAYEPFHPEVSVVATGVRYDQHEDILEKAKALIKDGLHLDVTVVDAMRTPYRNDRPGIVKIQFENKDDKIAALRAKQNLQTSNIYKKVFMRSSQSHSERLIHLNTQTILREMGVENRFRFTGSGRLVPKDISRTDGSSDGNATFQGSNQQHGANSNPWQGRNAQNGQHHQTNQPDN